MPVVPLREGFDVSQRKWVGFDLDHALLKYNTQELGPLCYQCLATYVVNHHGAPDTLLEPYDVAWLRARGAAFDFTTGDVVTLDRGGVVKAARHGTTPLSQEETRRRYGAEPWAWWPYLEKNERRPEYFMCWTFFEVPAALLLARWVDAADRAGHQTGTLYDFKSALISAFADAYSPQQFAAKKGGYFTGIVADTARYVRRTAELPQQLTQLRQQGKRLLLATNSYADYTAHLMTFLLGPEWASYFDVVCVASSKPLFFATQQPFLDLQGAPLPELSLGMGPLMNGNSHHLQQLANACSIAADPSTVRIPLNDGAVDTAVADRPSVIYVGDQLFGDVAAAKRVGWFTVAVIDEWGGDGGDLDAFGEDSVWRAWLDKYGDAVVTDVADFLHDVCAVAS